MTRKIIIIIQGPAPVMSEHKLVFYFINLVLLDVRLVASFSEAGMIILYFLDSMSQIENFEFSRFLAKQCLC